MGNLVHKVMHTDVSQLNKCLQSDPQEVRIALAKLMASQDIKLPQDLEDERTKPGGALSCLGGANSYSTFEEIRAKTKSEMVARLKKAEDSSRFGNGDACNYQIGQRQLSDSASAEVIINVVPESYVAASDTVGYADVVNCGVHSEPSDRQVSEQHDCEHGSSKINGNERDVCAVATGDCDVVESCSSRSDDDEEGSREVTTMITLDLLGLAEDNLAVDHIDRDENFQNCDEYDDANSSADVKISIDDEDADFQNEEFGNGLSLDGQFTNEVFESDFTNQDSDSKIVQEVSLVTSCGSPVHRHSDV